MHLFQLPRIYTDVKPEAKRAMLELTPALIPHCCRQFSFHSFISTAELPRPRTSAGLYQALSPSPSPLVQKDVAASN